jgi:UDP-2-acetamido-3-amino-2,3-dideoxy-glucuronate N-acetyltransferase
MNLGNTGWIADDFRYGDNLTLGEYIIVEPNVVVGSGVKIGHRVTLKSGTIMGDNSIIDDHCLTTGACFIGNNVNIRSGAIISKATIIEDYCFIGPGVITNHTKHVSHGREEKIPDSQLLTYIGFGSIVGSQASILAGVSIGPQVIVGGGTVVVKDLEEKGVYVGSPAKKIKELPTDYLMVEPEDAGVMYLKKQMLHHLKQHIPNLKFPESLIE